MINYPTKKKDIIYNRLGHVSNSIWGMSQEDFDGEEFFLFEIKEQAEDNTNNIFDKEDVFAPSISGLLKRLLVCSTRSSRFH